MNLASLLKKNIERYGEYPFLVFEGQEFSNLKINQLSNAVANGLKGLDVKRGERVGILLRNCPEVFVSFMAIFKLGAIAMPLIYALTPDEIRHILEDSEAEVVITNTELIKKVQKLRPTLNSLREIIVIDKQLPNTIFYGDIIRTNSDKIDMVETEDDDVAALLYTSGTTGKPKGVMLTHGNLYASAIGMYETYLVPEVDTTGLTSLLVLPLSHVFGILMMGVTYLMGNKTILFTKFDAGEALKTIKEQKVQFMPVVPAMLYKLLQYPEAEKYITSEVHWDSGSAPLLLDLRKEVEERFGGFITDGWGCTEGIFTNLRRGLPIKAGSVGPPIKGVEVKVLDRNGEELPPGEIGELVARGLTVMKGYWKNPELTAKVLKEGWFHSRDMGYRDEDGYFYLAGRRDDVIIKGGENIYPQEIENVLEAHPKITEAAVVGVPDKTMGEEVKAFIVLQTREKMTEDEIISYLRDHLGKFKVAKYVEFVDALPRSSVGKVLRTELRKRVRLEGKKSISPIEDTL